MRQAGVSLVEVMIASGLATVVGLGAISIVSSSRTGAQTVGEETGRSSSLRGAAERVTHELKQSSADRLVVTTDPDGNHAVVLQMPVSASGGVVTWGVRNAVPGNTESDRNRADWSVRYRVLDHGGERQLARELLTDTGALHRRDILLRDVAAGSGPGFHVTANGAMWHVALGIDDASAGNGLAFDIKLLN